MPKQPPASQNEALVRTTPVVLDVDVVDDEAPDEETPPPLYEKAWAVLERQVSDDNIDAVVDLRGPKYKVSTLQFLKMSKIALLEVREPDMKNAELVRAVGISRSTIHALVKKPVYRQIKADIRSRVDDLALPKKLSDHVADVETQDLIARAMKRRALHGKGPVAASNTAALADRAMPLKQQVDTMNVQIVIRADTLEQAERTEEIMAKAGAPIEIESTVAENE